MGSAGGRSLSGLLQSAPERGVWMCNSTAWQRPPRVSLSPAWTRALNWPQQEINEGTRVHGSSSTGKLLILGFFGAHTAHRHQLGWLQLPALAFPSAPPNRGRWNPPPHMWQLPKTVQLNKWLEMKQEKGQLCCGCGKGNKCFHIKGVYTAYKSECQKLNTLWTEAVPSFQGY